MKQFAWISTFACCLNLAVMNSASAGAREAGGGLINQDQLSFLSVAFKDQNPNSRGELRAILKQLALFPSQGETSALLLRLNEDGALAEDILVSPYVFKPICTETLADGTVVERDSSTLKGVRNAPICINLERWARGLKQKGSWNQIAALLIHEHVRHFGIEDVNEFLVQPTSRFIEPRVHSLLLSWDSSIQEEVNIVRRYYGLPERRITPSARGTVFLKDAVINTGGGTNEVFTTSPESIRVVIRSVSGRCGKNALVDNTRATYAIAPGVVFKPTKGFLTVVQRNENIDLLDWERAKEDCRIQLAVQSAYGEVDLPEGFSPYHGRNFALRITKVDLTDGYPYDWEDISRF